MSDDVENPELFAEDSFWGAVAEAAKGSGGSKGFIGKVDCGFAWHIYVNSQETGISQIDATFPYVTTSDKKQNEANSKEAKAKANKFVVENSLGKDPYHVFYIVLYRNTIVGRQPKFTEDKTAFYFPTSPAYLQNIMPNMRKACEAVGEKRFGTWWARINWIKDPDQSRAKPKVDPQTQEVLLDESGNPQMNEILDMYIQELFKDEASAKAAAASGDDGSSEPVAVTVTIPEGYDADQWEATKEELRAAFKKGKTTVAKLSAAYDLPEATVKAIVADLVKK